MTDPRYLNIKIGLGKDGIFPTKASADAALGQLIDTKRRTKHQMTKWTQVEYDGFIGWHEGVISQYPAAIQSELRDARTKFLAGVSL